MARRRYYSVVRQSLHYLARPHSTIPRTAIVGPAAWRGEDLERCDDWKIELEPAELAELERALAHAVGSGKPLAELTRTEFPLPRLGGRVREWATELQRGRGVVLVRGLPVERWTETETATVFWGLGLHLGRPGAQNGRGDLLGRVRDQGRSYADTDVRGYQTAAALRFHTDFADVVGLLCVRPAASGGLSRFVSSVSVYNELLRRDPGQVDRLFAPMLYDTRGEAGIDFVHVTPCRHDAGQLRSLYHGDYLRTGDRHPHAPAIAADVHALLDRYDAIAEEPGIAITIEFRPGDVQLLSNHTVLHSRTAYVDGDTPSSQRDLLRLWLSLGITATARGRLERIRELGRLVREIAGAKLRSR